MEICSQVKRGAVRIIIPLVFCWMIFCVPSHASGDDREKGIQDNLQRSRTIIGSMLAHGATVEELSRLFAISADIRASDLILRERFRQREEAVSGQGSRVQARHRTMEEGYLSALWEYLDLTDSLQASALSPELSALSSQLEKLKTLLDRILRKKKRPILGSLPYRTLNYPAREPDESSIIIPAYKGGNKLVSDEDLKDTPEAPISLEIAELAQSLKWNPVLMYEYVKNNIDTEWYWGCMKGAEETLRQKSGNDCDQATLLAALLRTTGFPTRYVRGTMEFFAGGKNDVMTKIKNLIGIDDPLKIGEFIQKAGIPFRPVIAGGRIANYQLEHIWVESQVPYSNYRGNVLDEQGKTWLGLDTSVKVKGYTYNNPSDIFGQSAMRDQLVTMRDDYLGAIRTETPL